MQIGAKFFRHGINGLEAFCAEGNSSFQPLAGLVAGWGRGLAAGHMPRMRLEGVLQLVAGAVCGCAMDWRGEIELTCDMALAQEVNSPSQRAHVLSEGWFGKNASCLACDADELRSRPANTKATAFMCPKYSHCYELKAFEGRKPRVLNDCVFGT
jgi:hypothetical protein